MLRSKLPALGRPAPDPNPQFVPPRLNPGTLTGGAPAVDPAATRQPGGSTVKTVNILGFAKGIDVNFQNATANQSVLFLPQSDAWRNMLMLRNSSAVANVYIGVGQDATTLSTIRLAAGQSIMLLDTVVPQDDLYFLGDAINVSLSCLYSTIRPDWIQYGPQF